MFVPVAVVILTFTAVGTVVSDFYKKGGEAVLSPGSVSDPISSITWKHGPDLAVEMYGGETTAYRDFNGRCKVDATTGALTISNLSLKDSGSYTPEINSRIMNTIEVNVITAVPKPTISKNCNTEETECTLTCEANITKDTGSVTYSWKIGEEQRLPSSSQLDITKDDPESVGKLISCLLKNPVSRERSDDIMSPFTNVASSGGVNIAGVIVPIVLVVFVLLALLGGFIWHKHTQNADKTWRQYFDQRSCLNCESSGVTQENTNRDVTGVSFQVVPTEDQTGPVSQDPNSAPVKPPRASDTDNDQAAAEPTGVSSGAESSKEPQENGAESGPETQAVTDQHQLGPEPTDTNKEADVCSDTEC